MTFTSDLFLLPAYLLANEHEQKYSDMLIWSDAVLHDIISHQYPTIPCQTIIMSWYDTLQDKPSIVTILP